MVPQNDGHRTQSLSMENTSTTEPPSEIETDGAPPKSRWRRFVHGSTPGRTRLRIFGVALGSFLLFKFWLIPIKVVGFSMFPTYKPGEINYINRYAYAKRAPTRGEIVSIGTTGAQVTILKRVLGVPGDHVYMRKGRVHINGEELDEPYLEIESGHSTVAPVRLKEDEFWVVGDNRMVSEFRKIHRRRIIGKPLF